MIEGICINKGGPVGPQCHDFVPQDSRQSLDCFCFLGNPQVNFGQLNRYAPPCYKPLFVGPIVISYCFVSFSKQEAEVSHHSGGDMGLGFAFHNCPNASNDAYKLFEEKLNLTPPTGSEKKQRVQVGHAIPSFYFCFTESRCILDAPLTRYLSFSNPPK